VIGGLRQTLKYLTTEDEIPIMTEDDKYLGTEG